MAKNERRFIPGCPGYKSDRNGNVYNNRGHKMSPFMDRSGAMRINIKHETYYVPRMVCAAFHDSVVPGRDIAVRKHQYRSKKINLANRFFWGTMADVKRPKNYPRLNVNDYDDIYRLHQAGWVQHDLADMFGVTQPTICRVIRLKGKYVGIGGNSPHKLTTKQAKHIRYLYNLGQHSQKQLAKKYHVNEKCIFRIIHDLTYKD